MYLALFPIVGYLAVPIGVVASGYLKNYLLGRACRARALVHHDGRTMRAVVAFGLWAAILGLIIARVEIGNIWILGGVIFGYGILYLPVAYVIDRRIK